MYVSCHHSSIIQIHVDLHPRACCDSRNGFFVPSSLFRFQYYLIMIVPGIYVTLLKLYTEASWLVRRRS